MVVDRFEQLAGEARDVLVADGLPEERLDALETMRQNLLHIARRVRRVAADHGADADVAKRVAHAGTAICGIAGIADRDLAPGLGALDGAEDHGEALDIVLAARLGRRAAPDRRHEIANDAEMAADAIGIRERRNVDRPSDPQHGITGNRLIRRYLGAEVVIAVPNERAARSDEAPRRFPTGPRTARAPAAAVVEHDAVIELEDSDRRRALPVPGFRPAPTRRR